MAERSGYPAGVRVRGDSVEINIPIKDEGRKYFVLPYTPTPRNIAKAGKLRASLMQRRKWEALTEATIEAACNPNNAVADDRPLFVDYAQLYLDSLSSDNTGTRRKYKGILKNKWMPFFASVPIADITPAMVRAVLAQNDFSSTKTANDALTPLRGVFDLAFIDEVIEELPTKRIRNKKIQADEPDPFLPDERLAIVDYMQSHWTDDKEIWYLYFVWQFWTGCRPGESLAINWADIDITNRLAKISKTLSSGKVQLSTKTNEIRNIHLNDKVLPVLGRLQQLTGHQSRLFISLHTDEPWTRPDKLSEKFQEVLTVIGIRARPAYNCRHTYATTMLNSMIDVSAAAYQMGHDIITFTKIYAKWINTERMRDEMGKLDYGD